MKLYSYQLFRALNYLTMLSISHRDMKPQNVLVDLIKNKVIICDFGSAKKLVKSIFFKYKNRLSQSCIHLFKMLPCTLTYLWCY